MDGNRLRQQVERILDENPQRVLSVILQGRQPGLAAAIAQAARDALQVRAITNAADLLPVPAKGRATAEATAQDLRPSELA